MIFFFLSFFYFCSNFKLHHSPFSGQNHSCTYTHSLLVALFCFISALLPYVRQNGQQESIDINVQRRYFLWGIEELGSSQSSYKYIKYLKFSPFIGIRSVSLVRPVQQIQDQKLIMISALRYFQTMQKSCNFSFTNSTCLQPGSGNTNVCDPLAIPTYSVMKLPDSVKISGL